MESLPNNNYILNVKTKEIRETKFNFGRYQNSQIDHHNIGDISMFRTFNIEDGYPLESPIYYVENETEEIIAS